MTVSKKLRGTVQASVYASLFYSCEVRYFTAAQIKAYRTFTSRIISSIACDKTGRSRGHEVHARYG